MGYYKMDRRDSVSVDSSVLRHCTLLELLCELSINAEVTNHGCLLFKCVGLLKIHYSIGSLIYSQILLLILSWYFCTPLRLFCSILRLARSWIIEYHFPLLFWKSYARKENWIKKFWTKGRKVIKFFCKGLLSFGCSCCFFG